MRDKLEALLEALVFPVEGEAVEHEGTWHRFAIQMAGMEDIGDGLPRPVLRLIGFEREDEGADWMISNIKEQYCWMLGAEHLLESEERIRAYLEGLKEALQIALTSPKVRGLMPNDLVSFSKHPLGLVRAKTADDFMNALMQKSRLGKLV